MILYLFLMGSSTKVDRPLPCSIRSLTHLEKDLKDHMLSLVQALGYARLNSHEDVLEITIVTPNGLPELHKLIKLNGFLPSNYHLKHYLDEIVWLHYIPKIRCRTAEGSLIVSALFGRGYLSILFPSNVLNEADTFVDNFCLLNIILIRLHESIHEVVSSFSKEKVPGDERYWLEVSASCGILYFGLLHAQERIKDGSIQPFCVSYFKFLPHHNARS
jgi:hypothetical protein